MFSWIRFSADEERWIQPVKAEDEKDNSRKEVRFQEDRGKRMKLRFQVADVNKPLVAVKIICENVEGDTQYCI